MSIETNLNVTPFFNDYDKDKEYYKVLFRPGVSVQARELTQIQDILQNQVESFGNHVFKSGTIVSGVNFQFYPNYSYAKILDTQIDGQPTAVSSYMNLYAKNSSNLQAKIINYKAGYQSTDPEMNYLYFKYINSGDSGEEGSFANSDVLTITSKNNEVFDFNIVDGGSGFSNTDTVQVVSALLVSNSNVTTGATISQGSGSSSANLYVIASNTNFSIVINNTTYTSDAGYKILTVRPIVDDLVNSATTSSKWDITPGENVVQGSNTALVVAKLGASATAVLTTDGSGIVNDVSLVTAGQGYIVPPYVTIRGGTSGSHSSLEILPQMFKAQVTVADSTYTGGGANPIGSAYAFGVTDGVIYQKGFFLKVDTQTIVVNSYSSNVNSVSVGFTTSESIVNNSIDTTLLDNATGSYNYAAPGASRLKLTPTLQAIPLSNVSSNNSFFTLVDFRDGLPYKQNKNTSYNVLEKEFEKRTNETSGSFVIDPFEVGTKDQTTWSNTYFNVVVDPGVAYINGIRIQTEKNTFVPTRRSNDTLQVENQSISLDYGAYIEVNNYAGYFNTQSAASISLYNKAREYYTNKSGGITALGIKIGTARIRSVVHASGVQGSSSAVYRIYLFDIQMASGKSFKDIRSIYYDGTGSLDGVADTIVELEPSSNKYITVLKDSARSALLYDIGVKGVSNVTNTSYKYRSTTQSANISTLGVVSFSIGDSFGFGNNAVLSSLQKQSLILTTAANAVSTNVVSNATVLKSRDYVTGLNLGTYFRAGDDVYIYNSGSNTESVYAKVLTVANNTYMTVDTAWPFGSNSSVSLARFIPMNHPFALGDDRAIVNTNSSGNTVTIRLGGSSNTFTLASLVPVNMAYDVNLNNTEQISKLPKRNVLVKISLANNDAGTKGPWCLGLPDVFRLNAVYVSNSSTVNTSSQVTTSSFYVNNGQNSDFYGHSYIAKQPGTRQFTSADWLLVDVDFFDLPTSTSTGYFTVSSYPLSQNNSSRSALGNTAVNVLEIPAFKTSSGQVIALENCVDFRPRVAITANVTSTVAGASVNPSSFMSFGSHSKKFPTPGTTFDFDYNFYLSRKDRVIVDLEGNVSVIEGSPGQNPIPPSETGDQISIGIINVAPYPSLPEIVDGNVVSLLTTRLSTDNSFTTKRQDYQVTDTVGSKQYRDLPKRYTMTDINKLEKRIDNLEYYNALTLLEKKTIDLVIPSSINPSMNRFKNGFFVDKFQDYMQIDLTNIESTATIDQSRGYLQPQIKNLNISGRFNYSNTITANSLHSEYELVEPGYGKWGESVLTLPTNGTYELVNQGRFTSAINGVGGDVQFIGEMVINPSSLKIVFKGEEKISDVYDVSTSATYDVNPGDYIIANTDPVHILTVDKPSVLEGSNFTVKLKAINVANNTTYAYTMSGTGITANDVGASLSGTFVMVGNTSYAEANVTFTANADLTTESSETLTFTVNTAPTNTAISITIIDDGIYPSFALNANTGTTSDIIREGDTVTFVLSSNNVNTGVTIPYTISGAGITSEDITYSNGVSVPLSGVMTVNSTGGSSLSIKTVQDFIVEGTGPTRKSEFMTFQLGSPANITKTIQILDVDPPAFKLVANTTIVSEGNAVNFSLTSSPIVNNGVVIPYKITNLQAADIDVALSGNLTFSGGYANLVVTTAAIMQTKGSPTFNFEADLRSYKVNNVATSVHILDTTAYPVTLSVNKTSIYESQTAIFTLGAINHPDGTTFNYVITGISSGDVNQTNGTFTVSSQTASLSVTANSDLTVENTEFMTLTVIANTGNVTQTVAILSDDKYTAKISANAATIAEGQTVRFTVQANGMNGNVWNYTITGVSAGDLNVANGTLTISSNVATLDVTANVDGIFEGTETLTLSVNAVSSSSLFANQVLTSKVLINDLVYPITLTSNTTTIIEGETVLFTLNANNYNGNTFNYTLSGISAGDINQVNGSFTVTANIATLAVTANSDGISGEGTEALVFTVNTASATGNTVSRTVLISDSIAVTHAVSANKGVVYEGDSVIMTLTSTGVGNATYTYVITGTGIDANDFVSNTLTGTITTSGNTTGAQANVTLNIKDDILLWGTGASTTNVTPFSTRTNSPATGGADTNWTNGAWCNFLNTYGVWHTDTNSTTTFDKTYTCSFPYTGTYTLEYSCDNAVVVYIDGVQVATQPLSVYTPNYTTSTSKTITVSSGTRTVRILAYNYSGVGAVAARITGVNYNAGYIPDLLPETFNFFVNSANNANASVVINSANTRYTLVSDKATVLEGNTVTFTLSSVGEGNATFTYTVSGNNITSADIAPAVTTITATGNGTYVVPAGVTQLGVYVQGAGGGGGGYHGAGCSQDTKHFGGDGGNGWFVNTPTITVTPGQSITYSIGAGGTGGAASANGTAGGNTVFGVSNTSFVVISANGGGAGIRGTSSGPGTSGVGGDAGNKGLGGKHRTADPLGKDGSNGFIIITPMASMTGTISPTGNLASASANITLQIARNRDGNDYFDEVLTFTVGNNVNLSSNVTIIGDPFPTSYTLTTNKASVGEGNSVIVTLNTTGTGNATYGYSISGLGIGAADFVTPVQGVISVRGDKFTATGNLEIIVADDVTDAVAETFTFMVSNGVNKSVSVTIDAPRPAGISLISDKQVISLPDAVKFTLTAASAESDDPVEWYMLLRGYDQYGTTTKTTSSVGVTQVQSGMSMSGPIYSSGIGTITTTSTVQNTTLGPVTYLAVPEFRPATGNVVPTLLKNTGVALHAAANSSTPGQYLSSLPPASRQGTFVPDGTGIASVNITFQPDCYVNHELYQMRAVYANGFFVDSPVITTTDGAKIGTWSVSADKNIVPANTTVNVKVSTASQFNGNRFNYQIQGLTSNELCGASLTGTLEAFSVNSSVGSATLALTTNANIATTKSANIVITSTIPAQMTPASGIINLQVVPGTVTMPEYSTSMDYVANTTGKYIVVYINTTRVPDGQKLTWNVQRRRNGSLLSTSELFTATIANNSYTAPFLIDYAPAGQTLAGDTRILTVYSGNTVLANSSTVIPANTNLAAFNSGVKIGY